MAVKVIMPKLGLTMKEGTVAKWLKKENDEVKKGDALFEVNTDKLTNKIEAKEDGVLIKILVQEGDVASCQEIVAVIGNVGDDISEFLD